MKKEMPRDEAVNILHQLKQDMLTGAIRKFKSYNNEELLDAKFYDAINIAIETLEKGNR